MRFLLAGYRRLLTHPRYGVWVILGTLLYLISPIDISPDILPILGQVDDVALIVLMISAASQWFSQRLVPDAQTDASTDAQSDADTKVKTVDVSAVEVEPSEG